MQKITRRDIFFMERALALAEKGIGKVHPNPLVGAVVVKNNRIIGEGAHEQFGKEHAEVLALRKAGSAASGSTLYVNLEPCSHFGKTPPCTDFILAKKVKRIVIGMKDPNPLVDGKGLNILKKAGLQVTMGVCPEKSWALNKDFAHWICHRMPYAIVKVAQSLDGKIATSRGESRWITGEKARAYGHQLRARSDAILIGINTVLKDNPLLSVRLPKVRGLSGAGPIKVVLDTHLRTPLKSALFSRRSPGSVLLVVDQKVSQNKMRPYVGKADILPIKSKNARLDLTEVFKQLAHRGIVRVLVEGGGEVIASALAQNLVQEVYFFVAPKIIGGKNAPTSVGGTGVPLLKKAVRFHHWCAELLGEDFLIHGTLGVH